MPQLRLALAQVDPTVGDLDGNAAIVRQWSAQARDAGAHLVAFPEMVLTGYPVEDLALRARSSTPSRGAVEQLAARPGRRRARRAARRRRLPRPRRPGTSATSTSVPDVVRPEGRAAERGRRPAPRPGRRPLRQAPPAQLRRLRRVPELRARQRPDRRPGARRRRRDRHLRGHLAGRRPGRARPARAGAGLLLVINGSPYERNKDDVRLELVRPPGRRGRLHARLRQHGRRAGRAGLRRRLDRRRRPTARCSPAAPQFEEELLVVDLDLPPDAAHERAARRRGRRGTSCSSERARARRTSRTPDSDRAEPLRRRGRGLPAPWSWACATTSRKNGFRSVILGLSGGIDSTLVAAIACDAHRRRATSSASRCRASYSSEHSRDDAAELAKRTGARLPDRAHRADGRRLPRRARAHRRRRGEPAGPGPRRDPDGDLQPGGPPGADDGQQERARRRLLDASTATPSAASTRSRTSRRPSSGSSPAGATPRRRGAARPRRSRRASITKPPSAELRPGQTDQDTLPPYDLLDALLETLRRAGARPLGAARRRLRARGRRHASSRWSTGPSGSAGSPRPARRRRRWRSAATAGCRSPAGGASTGPATGPATPSLQARGRREAREERSCRDDRARDEPAPYGAGPAPADAAAPGAAPPPRRTRVHHLRQMKERGERFAMLTAYDQYAAAVFEEAGIPVLLVGDSAANNVLGYETTVPVTVDELLPLVRAVTPQRPPHARRRRPAVRLLPVRPRPGAGDSRPDDEGGARARGQARGRRAGGAERRARSSAPASPSWRTSASPRRRSTPSAATGCRAAGTAARSACSTTRWRCEDAGAFAVVLEMVPAPVAARDHEDARDPDDRHRRRPGLRRPGAGLAGHDGPAHGQGAALRQALRRPARGDARRGPRLRRATCKAGEFPGPEHSFES